MTVLEGELAIWAAGTVIEAPTGSFVYGPVGVPHTFSVVSAHARFLLGTEPAGFEALSGPAPNPPRHPPSRRRAPRTGPSLLAALAGDDGIEILGPPGIPG